MAAARHVDPERPEPERAGSAIEQRPEHAGRVEPRHAQPVDRAVGRHQRAGVTVREERVVGDRRKRRRRCGASAWTAAAPVRRGASSASAVVAARALLGLGRAHDATHGPCQRPYPLSSRSASSGPHEPGAYACTGGGCSSSGIMIRQVSSTLSCRVKGALSPSSAAQSTSYGVGPFAALLGELHVERDLLRSALVAPGSVEDQPDAGDRVELDHELAPTGARRRGRREEAEPRRAAEHEPDLGLGDRESLAGADEPRNAGPAPVVDLEPHRRVRLGGRSRTRPRLMSR